MEIPERIVAQTAGFCVCDELPLRQLPLAIARQKSQDARQTTKKHGVSSCVRIEGRLLSSWQCAGGWVFSSEHRSEASAHHFGVFDTTILDGKIRRSRIVSVRDGSVLTTHKPRRDKLGSSPHHKITAIPLMAVPCEHGAWDAKHETGDGRHDIGGSSGHVADSADAQP